MVRIMTARGTGVDFFFWNLEQNVGLASPNLQEDVELVQFGYFCMARNPRSSSNFKDLALKIVPGTTYKGERNNILTEVILADQRQRGGTQDGHISVMKGALGDAYQLGPNGKQGFLLAFLNNNMRDFLDGVYPRLDQHASCPPNLANLVKLSFIN